MKKYKVKIGYNFNIEISAKNKKEAEEYAWFEFDQYRIGYGIDPEMDIQEIKTYKRKLRKLKRDIVISIVNSKDLVGIYFADTDGSEVLLECSPEKANKIIKVWNKKE